MGRSRNLDAVRLQKQQISDRWERSLLGLCSCQKLFTFILQRLSHEVRGRAWSRASLPALSKVFAIPILWSLRRAMVRRTVRGRQCSHVFGAAHILSSILQRPSQLQGAIRCYSRQGAIGRRSHAWRINCLGCDHVVVQDGLERRSHGVEIQSHSSVTFRVYLEHQLILCKRCEQAIRPAMKMTPPPTFLARQFVDTF